MKRLSAKHILISLLTAAALLIPWGIAGHDPAFAVAKEPAKPVITSAQKAGRTVTLKWKQAKGARAYQVYVQTGDSRWVKWKTVKKTPKNQKKYADRLKFRLKASGEKYQVYKQKKPYRLAARSLKARTFVYEGQWESTYRFVVQGVSGVKKGKYSAAKKVRIPIYRPHPQPLPDPLPAEPLQGWYSRDGNVYYYENGAPLTGVRAIEGETFWFAEDSGAMLRDQWLGSSYFGQDGRKRQVLRQLNLSILMNRLPNNRLNSVDLQEQTSRLAPKKYQDESVKCRLLDEISAGSINKKGIYRAKHYVKDATGEVKPADMIQVTSDHWTCLVKVGFRAWFSHRILPYVNNELRIYSRGNYVKGKEVTNTLEVVRQAGAYGVEVDVVKTADGRFIALHDTRFTRTYGVDVYACTLTLDRIHAKSALSRVPTLEQVLRECAKRKLKVIVELKQLGADHELYPYSEIGSAQDAAELKRCVEVSGIPAEDVLFYGISKIVTDENNVPILDENGGVIMQLNADGVRHPDRGGAARLLALQDDFPYMVWPQARGDGDKGIVSWENNPYLDPWRDSYRENIRSAFGIRGAFTHDFPRVTRNNRFPAVPKQVRSDPLATGHISIDKDGVPTFIDDPAPANKK